MINIEKFILKIQHRKTTITIVRTGVCRVYKASGKSSEESLHNCIKQISDESDKRTITQIFS